MEVGSRRGRGDLCTAQESSEEVARRGGAMRTRVCARVGTPQGVGALLLVGGAIVGAAVVAWRRRGDGKGAKKDHRGKEDDVLDGGVVENEQQKSDQSDENLGREDREVEADGLDGKEAEEFHKIQEQVDEIVADELDREPTDNFDPSASQERAEIVNDTDSEDVKNPDQNSVKSCVENEITPNATEGVKNSDDSALTINSLEIAHEEHIRHGHGADQETAYNTDDSASITNLRATESGYHDRNSHSGECVKARGAETAGTRAGRAHRLTRVSFTASSVQVCREEETSEHGAE